jgi:integrase
VALEFGSPASPVVQVADEALPAVHEFLADCRMKLSPASMAAYESDLTRLVALASPDSVLGFTPDLIRAYFLGLSQQGRRRLSTLYRKHSVLHEFGRWGVRKKLWLASPMDEIPRPPKPEHLPRPFTPEEIGRLMRLELSPVESVVRGLLYYTGLRVSPICQLKIGDVSFDEIAYPNGVTFPGVIRTIGKGNKPLVTPMHPALKELLFGHVIQHTDLKGHPWLLRQTPRRRSTSEGRPFTRRLIEQMHRRLGRPGRLRLSGRGIHA